MSESQLQLLIDDFMVTVKRYSYANDCYDWIKAEKVITDQIIQVFQAESAYDCIGLWPSIKDYCAGFKVNNQASDYRLDHINDHCYRLTKDMAKLKGLR